MCGIAGLVDFGRFTAEQPLLKAMGDALYHRGPDDHGEFVSEDKKVGLASRRLKIIDLSEAGRMPISNEDGTIHIVFNGEIYNFLELRAELQARHQFKSKTDTETILHLYEEEGIECVKKLDGMFAFAIWDSNKKELFLARDRMGKKPLYYYLKNNLFVFGSEIKAILKHPDVLREVNEGVIPHYLAYGYAPTPDTFYKNIHRLAPASTLVLSEDLSFDIQLYWDVKFRDRADRDQISELEAVNQVKDFLAKAVQKRLISDVPLGAFLSGGVDSSAVVALMAEHSSTKVKTLSIGFTGDESFNEAPHARVISDHFKTDHTEFMVEPDNFDLINTLLDHHDEPFGDSSALPTYIVSKLAREKVTVVLNGDGGDEVFAGYERFLGAQLMAKYKRIPSWVNSLMLGCVNRLYPGAKKDYYHFSSKAKRFFAKSNYSVLEAYLAWITYFFKEENRNILRPDFQVTDEQILSPYREIFESQNSTLLSKLLYLNTKTYLLDDLLVKMDRMSSANSIETRSPFLDKDLVEYLAMLPDRLKIKNFTLKYVLKQCFRGVIPDSILDRKKHGFGIPLGKWFREDLKASIQKELLSDDSKVNHYLNRVRLKEIFDEHAFGKKDWGHQLWLLLTLERWLRRM